MQRVCPVAPSGPSLRILCSIRQLQNVNVTVMHLTVSSTMSLWSLDQTASTSDIGCAPTHASIESRIGAALQDHKQKGLDAAVQQLQQSISICGAAAADQMYY